MPLPASALESQILPARLPGYRPSCSTSWAPPGELVWAGAGALGHDDGWIVLALGGDGAAAASRAAPGRADRRWRSGSSTCSAGGGALLLPQLGRGGRTPATTHELVLALWELVWAGRVTNDTLAPLRAMLQRRRCAAGATAGPRRRAASRRGSDRPPAPAAGAWCRHASRDATRRLHAIAEQLLTRHGIVTRGAVMAERVPAGSPACTRC